MTGSTLLRRLGDVRMADASEVGGKAAGLGELMAVGAHVPDGVVLALGVASLTTGERRSLLDAAAGELGPGPFAVRSSGVAEDSADRSFAGLYESVLDVTPDALASATDRVIASARSARVAAYQTGENGRIAVIVQRMVHPSAAGVALTADPVNGDRETTVVTAVRGTGDTLVSGEALGDEWVVRAASAAARRQPEHAIGSAQALAVATEARRIAATRGGPQDVEWAIDADGSLWILQARPMTALPPSASWESPAPGAFTRTYRFGEWISEPVTPLFESWLLTAMEVRFHGQLHRLLGQRAPLPHHVLVNGWYFYSLNWISPGSMLRSLPSILGHLIRHPRTVVGAIPSARTARMSFPILERDWRNDIQPRYQAAVADAEARIETLPVHELPALIDELADLAGEHFMWIAALSGTAYKMELGLAQFYRKHLRPTLGGSHLPLVSGFTAPVDPGRHAVVSLDWWYPLSPMAASPADPEDHARLVETRQEAEAAAFAVLASSPRRLQAFQEMLADAQHVVPIREEQTRELTLPWPVMRRGVLRIGQALADRSTLEVPEDIFFLTRDEVMAALRGEPLGVDVAARQATREAQAKLVPPPFVGHLPRYMQAAWDSWPRQVGAERSETALVSGSPASPGRATGAVRVIQGPDQFDQLQPGEVLVAPLTAPAWTPLFTKAVAVVTDVGSVAAHASIIAREYGIPAVVGCVDATARLKTGMRVTVDGSAGNVEPA